jgi:hypothetical protein
MNKGFRTFASQSGPQDCLSMCRREFVGNVVGNDWFGYLLHDPNTPFRIRIRSNHKLSDGCSSLKVGILFQDLRWAAVHV